LIKLSDYVWNHLADAGIRQAFLVTGGGAMHLNDSLGRCGRIAITCNHHEQACAMAAEGYARVSGRPAAVNVTTGPGGINALNGVFGAWTDSVPMLIISGQVKRETCMGCNNVPGLRQLGDQEADIISMVKGITKYAAMVTEPESIRYHLDKALTLATSGRQGPCWLDIPVDVQAAMIDEAALKTYEPTADLPRWDAAQVTAQCGEVLERLRKSERPVIMAGTGVRLADAVDVFRRTIRRLGIPVTTAWTHDLVASDDPLYCGRPGSIGDRAGNFAVQNADLVLVIGSRLNIRQVSYNWPSFARGAFKIQVDVDPVEFAKPTVRPDLAVHCDAKVFLEELDRQASAGPYNASRHATWLAWCRERMARYPIVQPKHRADADRVNPYYFVESLFAGLADDDVVVCANGAACVMTFQAAKLKTGQRLFSNSGSASMGYDLPAAIGAAVAREGRRVICMAGDGSLQMNIQELQTLAHHRWPIKLFVWSNSGYLSIRTTQQNFFGRLVGESAGSGVSFPDVVRLAEAYGIPVRRISRNDCAAAVAEAIAAPGPVVVDVVMDPGQSFEPKLSSRQLPDGRIVSPELDDMFPFLDRDELKQNILTLPGKP
jgi:acetolactate synthase I/II/III large subunit